MYSNGNHPGFFANDSADAPDTPYSSAFAPFHHERSNKQPRTIDEEAVTKAISSEPLPLVAGLVKAESDGDSRVYALNLKGILYCYMKDGQDWVCKKITSPKRLERPDAVFINLKVVRPGYIILHVNEKGRYKLLLCRCKYEQFKVYREFNLGTQTIEQFTANSDKLLFLIGTHKGKLIYWDAKQDLHYDSQIFNCPSQASDPLFSSLNFLDENTFIVASTTKQCLIKLKLKSKDIVPSWTFTDSQYAHFLYRHQVAIIGKKLYFRSNDSLSKRSFLFHLDLKTGKICDKQHLSIELSALLPAPDGTLLVASEYGTVSQLDVNKQKFIWTQKDPCPQSFFYICQMFLLDPHWLITTNNNSALLWHLSTDEAPVPIDDFRLGEKNATLHSLCPLASGEVFVVDKNGYCHIKSPRGILAERQTSKNAVKRAAQKPFDDIDMDTSLDFDCRF